MPEKPPLYYSVHVSNRAGTQKRGTGWVWSRAFDTPRVAKDALAAAMADDGTLGFVVVIGRDRRVIATKPESARKIIDHYVDLLGRRHFAIISSTLGSSFSTCAGSKPRPAHTASSVTRSNSCVASAFARSGVVSALFVGGFRPLSFAMIRP